MYKYILFLMAIVVFYACNEVQKKKTGKTVINVEVEKIKKENIHFTFHSTGLLASEDEVKLSFKTGGIIEKIYVKKGEVVDKGALLGVLNLSEIEARYLQAKSGFDKAERDYQRINNLYEDSVVTYEQFQNVETQLEVAKSNLKIAQFNLDRSKIYAPAKGKIITSYFEEGEMAGPGAPLFLFANLDKEWIVKCAVSDKEVVNIRIGDKAEIKFKPLADQLFMGIVKEIAGGANPKTGLYEVKISVVQKDERLFSGFIANVKVIPKTVQNVITVPAKALMESDGEMGYIYTPVREQLTVKKEKVKIVKILDNKIALEAGSLAFTEIITSGAAYLSTGDSIKINN
jgi:RND family efflux transporter MFP subunit